MKLKETPTKCVGIDQCEPNDVMVEGERSFAWCDDSTLSLTCMFI